MTSFFFLPNEASFAIVLHCFNGYVALFPAGVFILKTDFVSIYDFQYHPFNISFFFDHCYVVYS